MTVSDDDNPSQFARSTVAVPHIKRQISPTMTGDEERERRASIKEIMQDPDLSPFERRLSIQSLMDGRRRSSDGCGSMSGVAGGKVSMMASAAAAAAEFYDSEDDDDRAWAQAFSSALAVYNNDEPDASETSLSSSQGANQTELRTAKDSASGQSKLLSFQRKGRSASLKDFASSAQAVAAAIAAAEYSDDPEDFLHSAERMERSRPECEHYDRQCTIIAPCCGLAFGCRICHDECPVLPPPQGKQPVTQDWSPTQDVLHQRSNREKRRSLPMNFNQIDTHHTIDRFSIEEVICRRCYVRQSSKT